MKDVEVGRRESLPLGQVNDALRSYAFGSCRDRVGALWALSDWDADGLLDQAEMDAVIWRSMKPVEAGIGMIFAESLEVAGVRDRPASFEEAEGRAVADGDALTAAKKGWRERRREAGMKKLLLKMFNKTIANHFDTEVETPHRLRCIYAWATKAHQVSP